MSFFGVNTQGRTGNLSLRRRLRYPITLYPQGKLTSIILPLIFFKNKFILKINCLFYLKVEKNKVFYFKITAICSIIFDMHRGKMKESKVVFKFILGFLFVSFIALVFYLLSNAILYSALTNNINGAYISKKARLYMIWSNWIMFGGCMTLLIAMCFNYFFKKKTLLVISLSLKAICAVGFAIFMGLMQVRITYGISIYAMDFTMMLSLFDTFTHGIVLVLLMGVIEMYLAISERKEKRLQAIEVARESKIE